MTQSKVGSALRFPATTNDAVQPRVEAAPREVALRLFDELAPRLLRYVQAFGLDRASAEDVVQDVFLALFRHLTLSRSRENLPAWVFRVAHNLALKHRLRARARAATPLDEASDAASTAAVTDSPEQVLVARRRHERLQQALDRLPDRERQCILLRAEGFRYRDIARVLGVSLGTVASTLARAFKTLEAADE